MKAFHGNPKIKDKYLARVLAHARADEIHKGQYYQEKDGKVRACGVGCTIHSADHSRYEKELGIPQWLARVEDVIFEKLPEGAAKNWPENFLSSIHIGADLKKAKAPFMVFLMDFVLKRFDNEEYPDITKAIKEVRRLYLENGTEEQFKIAYAASAAASTSAASAASASAAAYAAYAAADPASAAAAAYAAAAAADPAAYAAAAAAYAAYAAADPASAAASAAAAYAAYAAADPASAAAAVSYAASAIVYAPSSSASTAYEEISDELLKILSSIKAEEG